LTKTFFRARLKIDSSSGKEDFIMATPADKIGKTTRQMEKKMKRQSHCAQHGHGRLKTLIDGRKKCLHCGTILPPDHS